VKGIIAFFVLSITISWSWWIPLALGGVVVQPGEGWPTHLPGLLGPAAAAIIVTSVAGGRRALAELWSRITRLPRDLVWWAVLGVTVLAVALPVFVNPELTIDDYLTYSGAPLIGFVVIIYVLIVNGFGEEIGWRGYLAESLLQRHSIAVTSFMVWLFWGIWHLPLFWIVGNFRDLGWSGGVGWSLGLLSGSLVLTWLYSSTGRSIGFVALWHTAFNFASATEASAGVGAAVTSTIVMIASIVLLCLPATWRRPPAVADARLPTERTQR